MKLSFHTYSSAQPQDRGQLQGNRHRPDGSVVRGDDLDLLLDEQNQGLLPRNDFQRLVAGVQEKTTVHDVAPRRASGRHVIHVERNEGRAPNSLVAKRRDLLFWDDPPG